MPPAVALASNAGTNSSRTISFRKIGASATLAAAQRPVDRIATANPKVIRLWPAVAWGAPGAICICEALGPTRRDGNARA